MTLACWWGVNCTKAYLAIIGFALFRQRALQRARQGKKLFSQNIILARVFRLYETHENVIPFVVI